MTRVDWAEAARDELADIYVAATPEDRERMAAVVISVERSLSLIPLDTGESRAPNLRYEFRYPLGFWFRVNAEATHARIVRVVRPSRRHP